MRTRITRCSFLVGLLLPMAAGAQTTGRVTGAVTSDVGLPVPNAQITVQATALRTITDTAGRYNIGNVPAGPHIIRATSMGHSPPAWLATSSAPPCAGMLWMPLTSTRKKFPSPCPRVEPPRRTSSSASSPQSSERSSSSGTANSAPHRSQAPWRT